jgi:hypothetical protein
MDPRDAALALARGRMAFGLAALLAPGLSSRFMFGRHADTPGTRVFARMLGGRDLAIGLGAVIALDRGAPVRGWLEAGALADGVDAATALAARDELSSRIVAGTVAVGGAAAAIGTFLARELDPAPAAEPGQPEAIVTGHPS